MDPDRRLELIALLAKDKAWAALLLIAREILDSYYPAHIFTGQSGDSGPQFIVALRAAIERIEAGP